MKLELKRQRPKWWPGGLGLFTVPCALAATSYLPSAGPPPLRWADPTVRVATPFVLPVLPTAAAVTSTNAVAAPALPLLAPMLGPELPLPNFAATPAAEPPAPAYTTPLTTTDAAIFSPQMLLPYFTRSGSNAVGPTVLIPVNFQPPPPVGPPPSSTATYETTPPAKP